jgi:hypothetical protein
MTRIQMRPPLSLPPAHPLVISAGAKSAIRKAFFKGELQTRKNWIVLPLTRQIID